MTAVEKKQFKPGFTAEYKLQKIEEYKEKHKQMFLDMPWLKPVFDEINGTVFAKYCPSLEHLIEYFKEIAYSYYDDKALKKSMDENIAKYGFFASREKIYAEFGIKESKKQRELREKQEKGLLWNPIVGSRFRAIDYLRFFHGTTTGYIPVAISDNGVWKQRHFKSVEEALNFFKPDIDCYFSPNTVYKPNRESENIRELTTFWLDLDIYKVNLSRKQAVLIIKKAVEEGLLPMPTMIVSSGNGLYIFWKLRQHAPGKIDGVASLWSNVLTALFDVAEKLGLNPDPTAMDMTRVLRMMGTTNTKSGAVSEVLEYNPDAVYSMSDLGSKWYPEQKKKKALSKPSRKGNKVAHLLNPFNLIKSRIADIETICKYRGQNGIEQPNRELTLFIYRHFVTLMEGHDAALEKTKELNAQFVNPITDNEVTNKTKTTKGVWKKIQDGKTKVWKGKEKEFGYHYSNEKLIKIMQITQEEMKTLSLKTIISKREKYDRDNEKAKQERRGDDGLTDRQRNAQAVQTKVRQLLEKGLKQKEIAEQLGMSKGRISQIAKEIEEFSEMPSYIGCVEPLSSSGRVSLEELDESLGAMERTFMETAASASEPGSSLYNNPLYRPWEVCFSRGKP